MADDERGVEQWRYDRMIGLGYAPVDALALLDAGVDWHLLEHLIVGLHCPPLLAKAIVS